MSEPVPHKETPLARARGLGAAHGGTKHFMHQRLTALANIPLLSAFIIFTALNFGLPYEDALETFRNPAVALVFVLFILSIFVHMWLGMREIIEDYVHGEGLKLTAMAVNFFFCAGLGAAVIFALLKINFGA